MTYPWAYCLGVIFLTQMVVFELKPCAIFVIMDKTKQNDTIGIHM
nr:MAG TPA: hypothetical protein [Caudoviricetes sp.]